MPKTKAELAADMLNELDTDHDEEFAYFLRQHCGISELEFCTACRSWCDTLHHGLDECQPLDLADAKANDDRRGFND
jgi:hypothetical protein